MDMKPFHMERFTITMTILQEHWTEKDNGAQQADFQDPESIRLTR